MSNITLGGGSPVDIASAQATIRGELLAMHKASPVVLLYGVKKVIDIVCLVARLYNRHRQNVLAQLPPTVVGALDVLVAACELLEDLNPPGPR